MRMAESSSGHQNSPGVVAAGYLALAERVDTMQMGPENFGGKAALACSLVRPRIRADCAARHDHRICRKAGDKAVDRFSIGAAAGADDGDVPAHRVVSLFHSAAFNTASRRIASNGKMIAPLAVLCRTPAFRSAWMSR
jgi:hypothetical protein